MSLQGQVAVISGGMGDIGDAVAMEFGVRGAKVSVADLRIRKSFAAHVAFQGDISDPEFLEEWLNNTEASLGPISAAVINAAVVTIGSVLDLEIADWRKQIDTNLTAAFLLGQSAGKRMLQNGVRGSIVFIGSWAAARPDPNISGYCVSKAGLRMLMKCLAKELAPHDILVNEVAPGYVDAGVSAQIFQDQPHRRTQCEASVPIRRLIAPADVAVQVAHLCEPTNRHMTGSVLLMDGGNSL